MSEKILRDAYVVIERNDIFDGQVYFHDKVDLVAGLICAKDDMPIGQVSNILEDVYAVEPIIKQLRDTGTIPATSYTPLFLNQSDLELYNIKQGYVCATHNKLFVVSVGVIELHEDDRLVQIDSLYSDLCDRDYDDEDDDYYVLTEKGLAYLEDLRKEEVCTMCTDEREESKSMDNLFGNLGFGKIRSDRFKLSMNGIAVSQNNGKFVVYNKDNNEFVDVTNMLFDIKDALFLLPAVEVNVGDTVLHEGKPYFIVDTTNEIKAVDYETCTQTVLIPKSTMFGIKYFQKVFSMFGDNFASAGDLFSNPMMLMALMEGKNSDLTQMMLFSSLSNGDLGSNPMALAMMLKGDKDNDSLSTIAMLSMFNGGTNPFAPKKKETKKVNADK